MLEKGAQKRNNAQYYKTIAYERGYRWTVKKRGVKGVETTIIIIIYREGEQQYRIMYCVHRKQLFFSFSTDKD